MKGESLVLLFSLVIVVMAAGCINILISAAALQETGTGEVPPSPAIPERVPEDVPVTAQPTTPEPVEMAYLEDTYCRMDETTETSYHCSGKVRIKSGVYSEVQVIVQYPDNNTFASEIFPMGGANPVLKTFRIFTDLKYRGQEPQYYVRLDKTRYFVNKNSNFGTAYINPPPTPVYLPWHAVVTPTHTVRPTTAQATVSAMKVTGSGLSVSTISPGTAPVSLQQFFITGSNFRQYPPPEVYLRKQGSSCEFCGVHATRVQYLSPEKIRCTADMGGMEGGAGTYDVLVTNSYLADSYAMLQGGLVVR